MKILLVNGSPHEKGCTCTALFSVRRYTMPEPQVLTDMEGIQNLPMLVQNMIWFLRCKEEGFIAGVPLPQYS